ncbi:MAG: class I SAM-dependent methyltransferase [Pseudomonadales bacterium]
MAEPVIRALSMSLAGPADQPVLDELALLAELVDLDGARVLELGCGAAQKTFEIVRASGVAEVVAAEVDAIQHEKNLAADAPANVRFARFGAEAIHAADASFDLVLMFKSLHHVPLAAMDTALAEIRRVLKPGGVAWISEPVFAGAFNEVMRIFHDEEQVRARAFEAVRRAVEQGLFELVDERFFLTPIRFDSLDQFERRMLGVTHTEHRLDAATLARVRETFLSCERDGAFRFEVPNRVDVLRASL